MKKHLIINLLVIIGALWYAFLFSSERMGLNTFLFSGFLCAAVYILHPELYRQRSVVALTVGTLLSAVLVVLNNSMLAKWIHGLSFFLLIGMVQQRELRFLWYAFLLGIIHFLSVPWKAVIAFREAQRETISRSPVLQYFRVALFPVLLAILFFLVYYNANQDLAVITHLLMERLNWFFHWNLSDIQLASFLFGVLLTGGLLWKTEFWTRLLDRDKAKKLELKRERKKNSSIFEANIPMGLKREFLIAKLTFGLLNGMLLVVNIIDLKNVWLSFGPKTAQELSQYVHAGTHMLILSILMAMAVVLIFYRRNLNFYPDNEPLHLLVYIWIIQNVFLSLSVGLRNMHYLLQYGLTLKRLGVLLFLIVVIIGLWTIFQKVKQKKTAYYLFMVNSWALYLCLLLAASINWEVVITRFNLKMAERKEIDVRYLISDLSDKNLYLLEKYVEQGEGIHFNDWAENRIKQKRAWFQRKMDHQTWRSWNWPDYRNRRQGEGEWGR